MVHALLEAHRVLKPNGILIDLRPAAVHRIVGIVQKGDLQPVAVMREKFDDDRAADEAIKHVVREEWFRSEGGFRLSCSRYMGRVGEFHDWLNSSVNLGKIPPHEWLVQQLERQLAATPGRKRIVVTGPLTLRVLRKPTITGKR